jgi:hypothetical protein
MTVHANQSPAFAWSSKATTAATASIPAQSAASSSAQHPRQGPGHEEQIAEQAKSGKGKQRHPNTCPRHADVMLGHCAQPTVGSSRADTPRDSRMQTQKSLYF